MISSDSRIKNSIRNIIWGLIGKIVGIMMPFVIRTLIIYELGVQYLGLSSLFTSILSVLSLAELGIGTALTYSMYAPAADHDNAKLCALLNFNKKCYHIIGMVVLIIGVALLPFLRYLVKGSYPNDINLYALYAIYLFNTVISYFLFAYKSAVLTAFQRVDITSKVNLLVQILQYIAQSVLLIIVKTYYAYILVLPISNIAVNLLLSYYSKKYYPEIYPVGQISKEEKDSIATNVKGLVYQKIGSVVLDSVDNIVISAFLGLTALSLYNNYYMIITALFGILGVFMNSIVPSVGNAIHLKNREDVYSDFKRFNFMYVWIVAFFSTCLLCLYQPFIKIWLGSDYLLPEYLVIIFSFYFFTHKWMDMNYVFQEAVGLWWQNRFIPIIAAVLNLTVNIILVQIIGLAGILISSILAILLVYNTGYVHVLFKYYFKRSSKEYIIMQTKYIIVYVIAAFVTYIITNFINDGGIFTFLLKLLICIIIPNVIILISNIKGDEFKGAKIIVDDIIMRIKNGSS